MTGIFISYSRTDQEKAAALALALESAGHGVWWDKHLVGGARYSQETERALTDASVVVVLWSGASQRSMWVADEAAVGRDKGNLVPVSLDGSAPPIGFRQIQVIDFSQWRGAPDGGEIAALLAAIARKHEEASASDGNSASAGDGNLATAAPGPAPPQQVARQEPLPPRRLAIIAASAAAALIAVSGFVVLKGRALKPQAQALFDDARITVTPMIATGSSAWVGALGDGVTQSIRHNLRQNGFKIVGYDFPDTAPRDEIMRLAESLDPDFILSGSITEIGSAIQFNLELIDLKSRESILSIQHNEPSRADIDIVDRVIGEVLEKMGKTRNDAPPDRISALYYEALALIESGNASDLEEAIRRLKTVTQARNKDGAAQAALAYAIANADRQEKSHSRRAEAEMAIDRAFEAEGDKSDAFLARAVFGYVYDEGAQRYARVKQDLAAALRSDPQNIKALKWMGNTAFGEGDFEAALRYSDASLELSPYHLAALGNKASSLVMLGERDAAKSILDEKLIQFPQWGWGYRFRATVALTYGDLAALMRDIDAAELIEVRSQNETLRAIADANLGRLEAADREIEASSSQGWAHYKKAIIRGDVAAAEKALAELMANAAGTDDRANVLTAIGVIKLYLGANDEAAALCTEATDTQGASARNALAPPPLSETCRVIAKARLGDLAPAEATLARFRQTTPTGATAYKPYWTQMQAAAIELATGDRKSALGIIDEVVKSGWATPKTAICRLCVHLEIDDPRGLFAALTDDADFTALMKTARSRRDLALVAAEAGK